MSGSLIDVIHFAIKAHGTQMRSGTAVPYIVHPVEVAKILSEHLVIDNTTVCAAVLHDVLEDTDVTHKDLVAYFGRSVADLVAEVSDDGSLTKREQRAATLARLPELSVPAHYIKLADGISNVRATNYQCPRGWGRSLKLAYVKTTERGAEAIKDTFVERHLLVPQLHRTLCREIGAARDRLSKANYMEGA